MKDLPLFKSCGLYLIVLLGLPTCLEAQTKAIFREYDFSSGNYILYIAPLPFIDSSRTYDAIYISMPEHLNEIKSKLIAQPTSETFPCDYDYIFYLLYKDSIVAQGIYNSKCGSFYINSEFYSLNPFQIFILKRYGTPLDYISKSFHTFAEANKFYQSQRKNKNLFFPESPHPETIKVFHYFKYRTAP